MVAYNRNFYARPEVVGKCTSDLPHGRSRKSSGRLAVICMDHMYSTDGIQWKKSHLGLGPMLTRPISMWWWLDWGLKTALDCSLPNIFARWNIASSLSLRFRLYTSTRHPTNKQHSQYPLCNHFVHSHSPQRHMILYLLWSPQLFQLRLRSQVLSRLGNPVTHYAAESWPCKGSGWWIFITHYPGQDTAQMPRYGAGNFNRSTRRSNQPTDWSITDC